MNESRMQYELFKDNKFYAIYVSKKAAERAAKKLEAKSIYIASLDGAKKHYLLKN